MNLEPSRETLDPQELREALQGLRPGQKGLLLKQARYYALGTDLSADELLTEAIISCLSEEGRKCPRDLNITTFLINAIRSIASHRRETLHQRPLVALECELMGGEEERPSPLSYVADRSASADETLAVLQLGERLEQEFAADAVAREVLASRMQGETQGELCSRIGLSPQVYEAAWKRIRRFIERNDLRSEWHG